MRPKTVIFLTKQCKRQNNFTLTIIVMN